MEFNETKHTPGSDAEMLSAADVMHRKVLEQMQCFCVIVQVMVGRMDGRFAEGQKNSKRICYLKTEMCARIDEGLKKEESAGQLVQNDSAAMKEK